VRVAFVALLVGCGATPHVPIESLVGRRIVEVHVRSSTMDEARLLAMLETHAGADLDEAVLRADAERLYALDVLDDVRVDVEPAGDGVRVRFELTERAPIGSARVEGDDPLHELSDQFRELEGGSYGAARVARMAELVVDRYRRRGYSRASGEVRREGDAVVLAMSAGPRYRISSLRFVGAHEVSEAELSGVISTYAGRNNVAGGIWRADLFSNDRGALERLLYDRGLLTSRLSEPRVSFDEQAHTVAIEVPLDEGGVYRLSSVIIDDEERPLPADAHYELPATGSVFSRTPIAALIARMQRDMPGAEVEPITDLDTQAHTLSLVLRVVVPEREEAVHTAAREPTIRMPHVLSSLRCDYCTWP
jgi:outer membrane protein assembly factor BamA